MPRKRGHGPDWQHPHHPVPLQGGLHGQRRGDVHGVPQGDLQGGVGERRLPPVPCKHVLGCGCGDNVCHLHKLPRFRLLGCPEPGSVGVHLQRRVHGHLFWPLHGLRGGHVVLRGDAQHVRRQRGLARPEQRGLCVHVQRRVHGRKRRRVHGVHGGELQGRLGERELRSVPGQHVLGHGCRPWVPGVRGKLGGARRKHIVGGVRVRRRLPRYPLHTVRCRHILHRRSSHVLPRQLELPRREHVCGGVRVQRGVRGVGGRVRAVRRGQVQGLCRVGFVRRLPRQHLHGRDRLHVVRELPGRLLLVGGLPPRDVVRVRRRLLLAGIELHELPRQPLVLGGDQDGVRRERAVARPLHRRHRVHMQRWLHGRRRGHVHGVRRGDVQGRCGLGVVH
mmetsp:Transcript_33321/g.81200  ORF Transcript_33321/g.81200 Transcript_33321/m.81200 type:complete len:391 (-) Transcript_33321:1172-2344(-)